ncbi:tRNA/rRNA methyltransferase [Shewanella litorisediminis]|uniref:tRNA (cytidine/uridine-2'-O-)-methyltransferase TrmJ n=1 Tax=Shewanella litorisediminis TaxID=1173586 RepID=A0ABX7G7Y9_9GAMM|nr:tRNA/rRNA methyltransferase [Shewanella litorisediminis]MCL2919202.1 tRNA/rRNA methyltransferase [Shewanella litorisediminis]QRH03445.1 tRNA/rRNA methyltransferase [Shewanella litorisediminis]
MLSVVLVEPARAANVGAAARAMKTMGFKQLILIGSQLHLEEEARWVAHGATDLLDNALVFDSFDALRAEFDLLVATTARERGSPRTFLTPDQLANTLEQSGAQSMALVFGRESSGLSNQELSQCDLFSYVPLAGDYPSLNLGQAVMVYSYALSGLKHTIGLQNKAADERQIQSLKHKANELADRLELSEQDKLRPWLQDSIGRLAERDCKLAHQLISDIMSKITG